MAHTVAVNIYNVLAGNREACAWRDRRADLEALEQIAPAVGRDAIRIVKITTAACLADGDRLYNAFFGTGCAGTILGAPDAPCAMGILYADAPLAANKALPIT